MRKTFICLLALISFSALANTSSNCTIWAYRDNGYNVGGRYISQLIVKDAKMTVIECIELAQDELDKNHVYEYANVFHYKLTRILKISNR